MKEAVLKEGGQLTPLSSTLQHHSFKVKHREIAASPRFSNQSEENQMSSSPFSLKIKVIQEGHLVQHRTADTLPLYFVLSSIDIRAYKSKHEFLSDGKVLFQFQLSKLFFVKNVEQSYDKFEVHIKQGSDV